VSTEGIRVSRQVKEKLDEIKKRNGHSSYDSVIRELLLMKKYEFTPHSIPWTLGELSCGHEIPHSCYIFKDSDSIFCPKCQDFKKIGAGPGIEEPKKEVK